jgi:hypothetical protein
MLLALVAALACLVVPAMAVGTVAEPCPAYEGGTFPAIRGSEDPEDYCREVKLGEGEELRQIDDTHAGVFWEDGTQAMLITAQLAHDAEGVSVPTTIAVTEPNALTLTVHHRAGNPAAGGAPFRYPVVAGSGWEGGFKTYSVVMPPPEVPSPAIEAPEPGCTVPFLQGRTLKAARRALRRADCRLGPVWGEGGRGAKVVRQYRPAGKTLPTGTAVGVKLAR